MRSGSDKKPTAVSSNARWPSSGYLGTPPRRPNLINGLFWIVGPPFFQFSSTLPALCAGLQLFHWFQNTDGSPQLDLNLKLPSNSRQFSVVQTVLLGPVRCTMPPSIRRQSALLRHREAEYSDVRARRERALAMFEKGVTIQDAVH